MNARARLLRPFVLAITLAALVSAALALAPRSAQGLSAPTIEVSEARCWRSLLETNDLLCIGRYNLPQQDTVVYPIPTPVTTSSAWCAYLSVQGGCTSSSGAVDPTDPTALQYGALSAWATWCGLDPGQLGCTGTYTGSGTKLYAEDRPPRIGHALAGRYFAAGHGITWADSTFSFCVEPTSDFSTTSTPACTGATFNSAANTRAAQRAQLAEDLLALIVNVQTARGLPGSTYTTGGTINAAGRVLALEAYPYMDQIIPDAFQAAASQAVQTPYSGTPAGVVVLETRIAATVAARSLRAASEAGAAWGISGGFYTTLIFIALGLVASVCVWKFAGDSRDAPVLGVITFLAISFTGVFVGGPSLSVIIVTIVILGMIGGWFILSRIPSG